MHLDEERLERLLHGELSPAEREAARNHVAECADCSHRIEAALAEETRVAGLLRLLDEPTPEVTAQAIASRARAGRERARLRWAAGFALALGIAGAAYALPGSPVARWVNRVLGWSDSTSPAGSAVETRGSADPSTSGVAVLPGEDFRIDFVGSGPGASARVSIVEGRELAVRGPAPSTSFTSEPGRIVVEASGAADRFEVEIPSDAARVEIRSESRRVLLKTGPHVAADRDAGPDGSYVLDLSPTVP